MASNLLKLRVEFHRRLGCSSSAGRRPSFRALLARSPNDMCIVGTTGYFREMTFHAMEDWVDLDDPKVDESMRGKSFSRVMASATSSGPKMRPQYREWGNADFALQYFLHRHPWVLFHEYMNHLRDMVYIARNHDKQNIATTTTTAA